MTSKENYSWNFDGSKWRLSHFLTPDKENVFEKILTGKVEMDEVIYANMYANFEAKADSDTQKFTWDFGDGHKSYLQGTRHKYEKAGKYNASLKITGNGEDNLYDFTVNVEDYSAPKVKIISLVPNPKGKDSGEYLIIQNKSNKKVNLLDWSIAAGWKNLYNHPIRKDFILKKGQSKKLTKKFCAFTLNNTKTKIELRDPTGEVVQKLKYDRTKNKITDDETFELTGKNWNWNAPENPVPGENNTQTDSESREQKSLFPTTENSQPNEEEIIIAPASEIEANIGKFTPDISWNNKKDSRIQLISYGTVINTPANLLENQGRVAGASTEKYFPPEKHWAVVLFDNTVKKINFGLNWALNKI
jgi:PKD repeat protein